MKRRLMGPALLFALGIGMLTIASAQQAASSKSSKTSKNPVEEITLPNYPEQTPPGPNQKIFEQHCLLCHTARYVTMQPHFSRTMWEKEVKKMVDVYGAPITAEEQQQIVEYLVAVKGPADSK